MGNADWIEEWHREGCALLPGFLPAEEMAKVRDDFATVFGPPERHLEATAPTEGDEAFGPEQFRFFKNIPFECSPALNLIALHPKLIAAAKQALGSEHVYLYQAQAWAKYTGVTNYDQPFHCDFRNHTLTVPSENDARNSITFIILATDVTEAHGPTHYVPKSASRSFADPLGPLQPETRLQTKLREHARSTAAEAGSVFAYGIDVYHRGTNMTAPGGYRYVVTSCYKLAGNDAINYQAWPHAHTQPWHNIFDHATPEQLACFGVPQPGDAFWTETTLRQSNKRYPDWDLTPYRAALEG